jgi:hypothetical protein
MGGWTNPHLPTHLGSPLPYSAQGKKYIYTHISNNVMAQRLVTSECFFVLGAPSKSHDILS